jgi:hypothetical protein
MSSSLKKHYEIFQKIKFFIRCRDTQSTFTTLTYSFFQLLARLLSLRKYIFFRRNIKIESFHIYMNELDEGERKMNEHKNKKKIMLRKKSIISWTHILRES